MKTTCVLGDVEKWGCLRDNCRYWCKTIHECKFREWHTAEKKRMIEDSKRETAQYAATGGAVR